MTTYDAIDLKENFWLFEGRDREIYLNYFIRGCSISEIGKAVKLSASRVNALVWKMERKIAEMYQKDGHGVPCPRDSNAKRWALYCALMDAEAEARRKEEEAKWADRRKREQAHREKRERESAERNRVQLEETRKFLSQIKYAEECISHGESVKGNALRLDVDRPYKVLTNLNTFRAIVPSRILEIEVCELRNLEVKFGQMVLGRSLGIVQEYFGHTWMQRTPLEEL